MSVAIIKTDRYTVDPLYQWDLNQVLEIRGLSLPSIPEIHFTNDAMDRAIVRQASMNDAGVIAVEVPNSLLQKPYTIGAYVCIYEGETFRSLYKITVPVKARKRPADYTLEDFDGEVYSFKAMENRIENLASLIADHNGVDEELIQKYVNLGVDLEKKYNETAKKVTDTLEGYSETLDGFSTDIGYLKTYITPQMFGAKGDGVTDDSIAIQNAILALPKEHGILYFPPGVYIHGDGISTGESYPIKTGTTNIPDITGSTLDVGRDIRLCFDGYSDLTILGYGAEIRSNDNNGETRNNAIFVFKNCNNIQIYGITINGRREERNVILNDYCPSDEIDVLRDNIIFQASHYVTLRDVTSINSATDGLEISGWHSGGCSNFVIDSCVFNNNHRQGVSVCGCKNIVITNSECSYNGSGNGIAPKAGVDLEGYNETHVNDSVRILNCKFDSNGQNVAVSTHTRNVLMDGCNFKNGNVNLFGNDGETVFLTNCDLYNSRFATKFKKILNNRFIYESGSENPLYVVDSSADNGESLIDGNIFTFIHPLTAEASYLCGIRILGETIFTNNIVNNAVSVVGSGYSPIMLHSKQVEGNIFNLTIADINGQAIAKAPSLTGERDCIRRNNVFNGYNISDYNDCNGLSVRTDYSLTKTYNLSTPKDKLYKVTPFAGERLLTVRCLNHKSVITVSTWGTELTHKVVYGGGYTDAVEVYKDSNGEIYLSFNYTFITVTGEFTVTGANQKLYGITDLISADSTTDKSSLTKIAITN